MRTSEKDWSVAIRGTRMFVYWRNEMTPRFKFEKRSTLGSWIGHGVHAQSTTQILEWVRTQDAPR
jgi:hypothetical protein